MEKERGSLERKFFPTSEAAPFLALLLGTCKGCFWKWTWQILFSSTPQKSEGSILPIVSRFLNCILFLLRFNYCSTSTPLMLSWAWQKGQGCFFHQLSLFCDAEFLECAGLFFVQIGVAFFCLCLCWGQNSQHHTFSLECNWNMWPLRRNLTQISSAPPVWDFDLVKSFCSNFCPLELLKAISVIAHKLAGCCWNADFLKRTR